MSRCQWAPVGPGATGSRGSVRAVALECDAETFSRIRAGARALRGLSPARVRAGERAPGECGASVWSTSVLLAKAPKAFHFQRRSKFPCEHGTKER